MFEVPSACLQARELLEVADFGSIGTNDLIQYLFAVDRNNELVAYDYHQSEPGKAQFGLTGKTLDAGGDAVYKSRETIWKAQAHRFAGYQRMAI